MGEVSRLGKRLRQLRRRRGLTQLELARRSGVSRTTIAGIEIGQRDNLSLDGGLRLARALGVSVEMLTGFDTLEQEGDEIESESTQPASSRAGNRRRRT